MKKIPKYIESAVWNKEEISDPYQVIAESFSSGSLVYYRKNIKKIIHFSFSEYSWKENPADIFYRFGLIEKIINAAYLINKEQKKNPLDIRPSDVFNPNLYSSRWGVNSDWENFPRALSMKEFMNPYLVLRRFFEYRKLSEWKDLLRSFSESIFDTQNIEYESVNSYDCLTIYFHLVKLLEAVHLIDVREITHIEGRIKNKFSKSVI
ncbi:hypothetical protein [Chitinophaga sancti]|uniref:Uncharacterized protein n=1 Tax=Chitinophaga sancti TaxID=1004 RepID=A0A1K1SD16_9BACT|nr:hypothetical protein [Chitinophaga sancti]WQD59912.1 hypothetical protein U0033_18650 [Chitinophaga sancti]WQG87958.1 hypothetical protein SR876_23815 [Chitinophaga sancti]SFW82283.1 hypothetical protein SAMN05661012_05193 [Chitinophaga sancti]